MSVLVARVIGWPSTGTVAPLHVHPQVQGRTSPGGCQQAALNSQRNLSLRRCFNQMVLESPNVAGEPG